MKLSKKGLNEILDGLDCLYGDRNYNKRHLKSIQFNQSHFEGVICLTIDQAKGLLEIAKDYRMYLFEHCRIPLSLSSNEAFTALREQIEQVERRE